MLEDIPWRTVSAAPLAATARAGMMTLGALAPRSSAEKDEASPSPSAYAATGTCATAAIPSSSAGTATTVSIVTSSVVTRPKVPSSAGPSHWSEALFSGSASSSIVSAAPVKGRTVP